MIPFGVILLILGAALTLAGVLFDPSVSAPGVFSGRTINLGLQQDRQILVMCGLGLAVVGAIFTAAGTICAAIAASAVRADTREVPPPPPSPAADRIARLGGQPSGSSERRVPVAPGDRVRTDSYGDGTVETVEGGTATVRFDDGSSRTVARIILTRLPPSDSAAAEPPDPLAADRFPVGSTVRHPEWGTGTVRAIAGPMLDVETLRGIVRIHYHRLEAWRR